MALYAPVVGLDADQASVSAALTERGLLGGTLLTSSWAAVGAGNASVTPGLRILDTPTLLKDWLLDMFGSLAAVALVPQGIETGINGKMDPGELVTVWFDLKNLEAASAGGVMLTVVPLDPYATIETHANRGLVSTTEAQIMYGKVNGTAIVTALDSSNATYKVADRQHLLQDQSVFRSRLHQRALGQGQRRRSPRSDPAVSGHRAPVQWRGVHGRFRDHDPMSMRRRIRIAGALAIAAAAAAFWLKGPSLESVPARESAGPSFVAGAVALPSCPSRTERRLRARQLSRQPRPMPGPLFRARFGTSLEHELAADQRVTAIRGAPGKGLGSVGFGRKTRGPCWRGRAEVLAGAGELLGVEAGLPLADPVSACRADLRAGAVSRDLARRSTQSRSAR